jgi:hypothetical protein
MRDRILLSLLLVGVLTACPGSLEDPERFDTPITPGVGDAGSSSPSALSCGNVESDLLAKRCATAGCHDSTSSAAGLDLGAGSRERLTGKAASGGAGVLIAPNDAAASILYQKVTASPPFGGRMPFGAPLEESEMDCLRRWIEGGT